MAQFISQAHNSYKNMTKPFNHYAIKYSAKLTEQNSHKVYYGLLSYEPLHQVYFLKFLFFLCFFSTFFSDFLVCHNAVTCGFSGFHFFLFDPRT